MFPQSDVLKAAKTEEQGFLLELIDLYRSLPALWDVKCPLYMNRKTKQQQYKILLDKYHERYPGAEKKHLARRINVLRTNYKREVKRVNGLKNKGLGDAAKPTLWYFHAMDFLRNNNESIFSSNFDMSFNETNSLQYEGPTLRKRSNAIETYEDPLESLPSEHETEQEEEYHEVSASDVRSDNQDEFSKITELWTLKLRKMQPNQQLLAEKFINDILLEGQLGSLHRNSMQLNCRVHSSRDLHYTRQSSPLIMEFDATTESKDLV